MKISPLQNNEATINAAFDPASPTSGIQEAIDALGKGGGCVRIPAGQWPLRRSIVLSSRVQLAGDGPATQLTEAPPKILRLVTRRAQGLAQRPRPGARAIAYTSPTCRSSTATASVYKAAPTCK